MAVAAFTLATLISSVVLPVQKVSAATKSCTQYTFSYGSSSTCVTYIQVLSNAIYANNSDILGYRAQLVADGQFGSKTRSAIDNLQAHSKLRTNAGRWIYLVADGVVGSMTWYELCSLPFLRGTESSGAYVLSVAQTAGCSKIGSAYSGYGIFIPVVY